MVILPPVAGARLPSILTTGLPLLPAFAAFLLVVGLVSLLGLALAHTLLRSNHGEGTKLVAASLAAVALPLAGWTGFHILATYLGVGPPAYLVLGSGLALLPLIGYYAMRVRRELGLHPRGFPRGPGSP